MRGNAEVGAIGGNSYEEVPMKRVWVLLIGMVFVLAALDVAHAGYTFTSIGGYGTMPQGINNNTIVGGYEDGAGIHGFTLQADWKWTYFDCLDAKITDAAGINNAGTIVGIY